MGGLKRKIPIVKIENKNSRAVSFSKRSSGLYSKASELCLLSDAHIAIIATPVSSNSNVSFFSFGHSSVDTVVSAFLSNQRPRDDLGLGFWWEDERLAQSEDPEELRNAMDSMSKMLQDLKEMRLDAVEKRGHREDVKKKKNVLHQKQTLNLQPSSSASLCIQDQNLPWNFEGTFNKNSEERVLAISDNSNNNEFLGNLDGFGDELEGLLMNLEEIDDACTVTTHQNPFSGSEAVEDGELVMHRDLDDEDNLHLSDMDDDQILAISDNNNNVFPGNLGEFNQELDLDQMIDFETNCQNLWMNLEKQIMCSDFDAVEDVGLENHRDLDADDLHFSDFFNELTSIVAP